MGNCPSHVCEFKGTEASKEVVTNVNINVVERIQQDFILTPENENVIDPYYGLINVLENKKLQFRLVQKIMKFTDVVEFKTTLQNFENRFYGLNHPNLLIIHAMQSQKVEEFFSTSYVLALYLDYVTRTFQRELILRQKSLFSEKEILYILDSLVGALAFLQTKGIAHKHLSFANIYIVILPNGNTCLKLSHTQSSQEPDYPAPEQFTNPQYNEHKSDVFSLGALVLELCTLTKCSIIYKQNGSVNEEELRDLLLKVADRYSERLYEFLGMMLQVNPKNRLDFVELDETLSTMFQEITSKRIAQNWQYQDYQYCIADSSHQSKSPRRKLAALVHPEISKTRPTTQKSSFRQLSSVKGEKELIQGIQSLFPNSNLSALGGGESSPQLSHSQKSRQQ